MKVKHWVPFCSSFLAAGMFAGLIGLKADPTDNLPDKPVDSTTFDNLASAGSQDRFSLYRVRMKVDFNRNGEDDIIGDAGDDIPEGKFFRFWLNEDNDEGDDAAADDLLITYEHLPDPNQDLHNNEIASLRDLEDFTRLHLDLSGLSDLIEGDDLKVGLRFTDVVEGSPSIRVFLAADEENGSDDYLFNLEAANAQVRGDAKYREGVLTVTDETALFPDWAFESMNESKRLHLIFEGVEAGKGTLALEWLHGVEDVDPVATAPLVPMELVSVRQMYEHWTAADLEDINPGAIPQTATPTTDSGTYSPDGPEEMEAIVFVHGWRMKKWERRNFADTSFKRLWQLGYAGRFYHFSWPTEWTPRVDYVLGEPPADRGNYARSERKAYISGRGALVDFLQNKIGVPPEEIRIFAHSMGGIVVSEALLRGAEVHTYAACQTSMAGLAYGDPPVPDSIQIPPPAGTWETPEVYKNYPTTEAPYFAPITDVIYNFYNPEDSALGVGWRAGQDLKPNNGQQFSPDENYHLDTTTNQFFYQKGDQARRDLHFPNQPTEVGDTYEIFAHCAESRSPPLGRISHPLIARNFNLRDDFLGLPEAKFTGSQEDHSGQFRGTLMIRYMYWRKLMSVGCFDSARTRTKVITP